MDIIYYYRTQYFQRIDKQNTLIIAMEQNKINSPKEQQVDYVKVFKAIWEKRSLYFKTLPVVFILSCLYIICIPRTYTSETEVALETESQGGSSGVLGNLASTFGFDLSAMESNDAITPLLYPDLLKDNGFISGLFDIKIRTADGRVEDNLYNYTYYHTAQPWWSRFQSYIQRLFKKNSDASTGKFDPYHPTKRDFDVMDQLRSSISLKVDKKTGAITITTTTQDPLISKTLADSVREHLQMFITEYRTKKARKDVEYYEKLVKKSMAEYETKRRAYANFADGYQHSNLVTTQSKKDALEKDANILYENYGILNSQLQAAKARVQERTPAFMVIRGAEVPLKPTAPKRVFFVLVMTFLAFCGTTLYVLREIVK